MLGGHASPYLGRVDGHPSDTLTWVSFAYALSKQTVCSLHTAHWKLVLFNPVGWPFTGLAKDSRERQAKDMIGQFPKEIK